MPTPIPAPLPQTCYPAVWLWPGQGLYSGPALGLQPHSGSVWCLAVGIAAPLTVDVEGHRIRARTALIPPRVTHHLVMTGPLVSCYLDPASHRTGSCRRQFDSVVHGIGIGHRREEHLLTPPADDLSAVRWLDTAAPSMIHEVDTRIELAAKQIREDPGTVVPAGDLAAAAGLSESRFLHLFRAEVGTSLRRYRMWCRLLRAGALLAAGHDLTTAAVDSGFASPSHLADRFKSTFGLSASRLLATGLQIRVP
ncbi:helix-turn-helix domain-containing protein [Mycolicibacterium goodii]|uniref:helix-turn-helix domain-containing protein n=1 Tax=Mycolicibacterium goodii TaxID=134601 RepID=UPI001F04A0EF|nr:helix-turn-helix domain-containing protein [Mycolicibacterium goodii]ULN49634.1 helix-turn-helix domain-containing protein [Mycolicibacterium goodii]